MLEDEEISMASRWDELIADQGWNCAETQNDKRYLHCYLDPSSPHVLLEQQEPTTAGPALGECMYSSIDCQPQSYQQPIDLARTCAVCCMPASSPIKTSQGVLCCRLCLPAWHSQHAQPLLPTVSPLQSQADCQPQHQSQHHTTRMLQDDMLVDQMPQHLQTYQLSGAMLLPCNSNTSSTHNASHMQQQHSYTRSEPHFSPAQVGGVPGTVGTRCSQQSVQLTATSAVSRLVQSQQLQEASSRHSYGPSAAQLAAAAAAAASTAALAAAEAATKAAAAAAMLTDTAAQQQQQCGPFTEVQQDLQGMPCSAVQSAPELQPVCPQPAAYRPSATALAAASAATHLAPAASHSTCMQDAPHAGAASSAVGAAADNLLVEQFMQDVAIKIDPERGKLACSGMNPTYSQMLATRLAPYLVGLRRLNLCYNHQLSDDGFQVLTEQASQLFGSLQALQLTSCGLRAPAVLHLGQLGWLQQLRALSLAYNNIGDQGLISLATLCAPQWPHLQELDLSHCCLTETGMTALAVNGAMHLTQLRSLDLSDNSIGDDGLMAMGQYAASHWRQLQSLDLSMTGTSGKGFVGFIQSGACYLTGLQALNLSGNKLEVVGATALARAAPLWHSVTNLDLSYCSIGEEGAQALATGAAPYWQQLAVLDLTANGLGDIGLTALSAHAAPHLTQLEKLMLNCNSISDVGVSAFVQHWLGYLGPSLRTLQLSRNLITAAGFAVLASTSSAKLAKELRTLVFDFNPIGGAGAPLAQFGGLVRFSSLQDVHMHACGVSAAGAADLAARLPHLQLALGEDNTSRALLLPEAVFGV